MKLSTEAESRSAFANFDDWVRRKTTVVEMDHSNLIDAAAMLRRLDLTLRTPDAIHLAIAQRLGAELATFDQRMADCAPHPGNPRRRPVTNAPAFARLSP
ncbi:MAG: PIN domain-containing protein [Rhizomicrobium sp.]